MSVVPVMALIPILAHQHNVSGYSLTTNTLIVAGFLVAIIVLARYILPFFLKICAANDNKYGFALSLFLMILLTVWLSNYAGMSETLGAFLFGMLLSTSDFKLMLEDVVSPLKSVLMSLFFFAVGMSIQLDVFFNDLGYVLLWLSAVLIVKTAVLILLALIDGKELSVSIKSGFALNQVGEFAFVLFGIATTSGLLDSNSAAIGFIIISISMIITPTMNGLGDRIVSKYLLREDGSKINNTSAYELVIVGLDEVGFLISLLAERANISYIAFDNDYESVKRGKALGLNAHYGDILKRSIQDKAQLSEAKAAFITVTSPTVLKNMALRLTKYQNLDIYARTNTREDEVFLKNNGVKYAGSIYVESTLQRGRELLNNFGFSEQDSTTLIDAIKDEMNKNDCERIKQ